MMDASQSLPDLVRAARDTAKLSQDRVSEILNLGEGQSLSDAQSKELIAQTVTIELVAVDIFAVFEARMQRHFKRGPFARKLQAALLAEGKADLANKVHQHYLAINVIKHGTGASFRELLNDKSTLFVVKKAADVTANDAESSTGLIDVTAAHFFDGLAETILDAYHFLESR